MIRPNCKLQTRLALACTLLAAPLSLAGGSLQYPQTHRGDVVEELHGVTIADPYRWLEEPDAPETRSWIEAQNEVTFGFLRDIPGRERINKRLTALWNYERFGLPYKQGGHYFYSHNTGLQNQNVIYVADALDAEPRVLLNPNDLSDDGTISLSTYSISEDGRHMAYGLSSGGSDWIEFHVRDVATGNDLEDHVKWVKFSGASWMKDGSGFFYSRYDEPEGHELASVNYFQKLYFHRIGTPQSQDALIYERPDKKEWGFGGSVTEDGRYLVISNWEGTERKNRILYKDLSQPESAVVELLMEFDAQYNFVGNDGTLFYFFTDLDAPRGRVVAIDITQPARGDWKELIPQAAETLRNVSYTGGRLIANYLKDAHTQVKVFDMAGAFIREVELPGLGSAGGFGGRADDPETFYSYTSFSTPATIYRYDVDTGESTVYKRPKVDFDPEQFESRQVFYTSKDGTRVPMFITHRKGIKLDGDNPTYLYGYGGFNIPITPSFSVSNLVWMELGGVYAVANLRGGGEYGKDWHNAGRLANKQNVFDDFIAAAEWLVANGYTQPSRLAIGGGSNGGLLVGACMAQRPDLFGAALPAVGVMDMLRFHKFTIGWAWVSDYGSPDDPEMFKVLRAYSPLHNLHSGSCYPATLITTGDHDDRVVPAHSFKFAAALQYVQSCEKPALIRIETRAGHGAGKPTQMIIEELTDRWAFLTRVLEMKLPADFQ